MSSGVGLATIGTVAWHAFNHHVKSSLAHLPAPVSHATAHAVASTSPGSPIYDHALSSGLTRGVTRALTPGAAGAALAFVVALVTIRVPRENLPKGMVVV